VGSPVFHVWPEGRLDRQLGGRLARTVGIGRHPTIYQNPRFGLRQIVDIAVRALSPGVNDPTTAVTCIDYLGAILCRAGSRDLPVGRRLDASGQLRVLLDVPGYEEYVESAFDEIRRYGNHDVAVTTRLLETLALVGARVKGEERRQALWRHARLIAAAADRGTVDPHDRALVNDRLARAAEALGAEAEAGASMLAAAPKEAR
jgi:uncharacterized membrane protein